MARAILLASAVLCLSLLAVPASASPSITYEMTPQFPDHVVNPGGTFLATCWVEPDGSTPANLEVWILGPSDEVIYYYEVPQGTTYDLYWSPYQNPDGIYHYKVDYTSEEGDQVSIIAPVLVAGETTGFCAFKFYDTNEDGIFDQDSEALLPGWEICVTPNLGCRTTSEDGAACWFFIPSGIYTVCETLQLGYINTTPLCQVVDITPGVFEKVFFGNVLVQYGACCFPDGSCVVLTEEDCIAQGGLYQGDNTLCDPNPCPQRGACCFPDGTCLILGEADCIGQGGIYYGDNTVCDPNPCPQIGACCLPDGSCIVTTQEDCIAHDGIYQGNGTDCDPNPCPPVPTDNTSWGRIKGRYR